MAQFTLDSMMKKIQALLDRADHPNTPEAEADASRAKAEQLMAKYRIEESTLIEQGALAGEQVTPIVKDVPITPSASEYRDAYYNIMIYVAQHAGVRAHFEWRWMDAGLHLVATLVGYESDVRFAEALFTNARLVFGDRMEPKPRKDLSDEDNVYRMRSAGIERIRIAALMDYGTTNSATAKVTNMYKRACKARGEEATLTGRGMNVKAFRETYVDGFLTEFYWRLHKARNAADTSGAELVLAGRKDAVDEAFYQQYPNLRPSDAKAIEYNDKRTDAQKRRDEARAMREYMKQAERQQSAAGRAGKQAGARAASEVNVGGNKAPGRLS